MPQAIDLRISGVYIIDMAVGEHINMLELKGIASDPVSRNVITVDSFGEIDSMMTVAVDKACNGQY